MEIALRLVYIGVSVGIATYIAIGFFKKLKEETEKHNKK